MTKAFPLLLFCATLISAQPIDKNLRVLADQGDPDAQVSLGNVFLYGDGAIARDDVEAFKWYLKAANQGSARGQNAVGNMYFDGLGVEQSDTESVRWYRLAAEQGNTRAETSLGYAYQEGRGVPRDDQESVKWYRKAVKQGMPEARLSLALQYLRGRAKPEPGESVLELFEKMEKETDPRTLAAIAAAGSLAGRFGMSRDVETAMRVAEEAHLNNEDIVLWFDDLYLREAPQAARLRIDLTLALDHSHARVAAFLREFDDAVPNR